MNVPPARTIRGRKRRAELIKLGFSAVELAGKTKNIIIYERKHPCSACLIRGQVALWVIDWDDYLYITWLCRECLADKIKLIR